MRQVGAELGMPESVIWRQPFPGPGLAIRVIGEVTRERLDILRKADTIVQQELRDAADWARLPYDLLERISRRIINEVKGVNRVVYDVSSKPPSTIEWE